MKIFDGFLLTSGLVAAVIFVVSDYWIQPGWVGTESTIGLIGPSIFISVIILFLFRRYKVFRYLFRVLTIPLALFVLAIIFSILYAIVVAILSNLGLITF